ncbi:Sensor protein ZraS [Tepidimonas sediminis]|uniref:histidine kinase n=1 Tax=Tepidimonas sediminis TaxID=2588941 RepID=A0A554WND2_9BURK|nr:ATP-binding protein [Tepidimonas sediminis]TSE25080.1 Sensor protein ZraS [Tepidimonas sediminis]
MNTGDWRKAETAARYRPSWPIGTPAATAEAETATARRLWRPLMTARLAVALALLGLEGLGWLAGQTPSWVVALCVGFAALAGLGLSLPPPAAGAAAGSARWLVTVWADLLVFGLLEAFAPGGLNFTPLFVWPVLLAAVLGPRLLALGTASAATLMLLARAWQLEPAAGNAAWLQAAVTGTGLLVVALLASHLTARLAGEAAAARRSRAQAQLQAEVNRLIANALGEGIVVAGADARPRYVNPAAARMLGVDDTSGSPDELAERVAHSVAWRPLAQWLRPAGAPAAPAVRDLALPRPDGCAQRVRAQLQTARGPDDTRTHILLLQDLHALEQRVHTEKLAAMGRVSAAVAHEIRNPLAAIAQASALLQEDDPSPAQRRLLTLIEQNVRRLNRTIDDVLEAARNPLPDGGREGGHATLALDATVDALLEEWLQQRPQGARLQRQRGAADTRVTFDAEHLRRVLTNLLDNADRHASGAPGAIRVETARQGERATLVVWSDSAPIEPPLREHLFEPFASSHSRSSGLGLYLSRELCRRYDADLTHEAAHRHGRAGNAFVVSLPAS